MTQAPATLAGVKPLKYTHEAMIDLILEEPDVKPEELAKLFEFSPNWVNRVLVSDSFQARLAQRRNELMSPQLRNAVETQMQVVTMQALDVLQARLDSESSASLALEALGVCQGLRK